MITLESTAGGRFSKPLIVVSLSLLMLGVGIRCSTMVLGQAAPPSTPPKATAPTAPKAVPASGPSDVPWSQLTPEQKKEKKIENLLDYLEKDYGKKSAAPYWVTRSMGVISLNRSPRPTATTRLLEILEKDKHDVVRLLAWQAIISRIDQLDDKSHARWLAATYALAEKNAFNGALRISLLEALATAPPNQKNKRIWSTIFTECNAWEPQDIPVLDALGKTLAAWKSGPLLEVLIKGLTDPGACVRSEYVLHAAGSSVKLARDHLKPEIFDPQSPTRTHPSSSELWKSIQTETSSWYQQNRASWKEVTSIPAEAWKSLKPVYITAPIARDQIDPDDKFWTQDLELGMADLDQFDVVFTVDATGSMGDVLAWLRRDIARVMKAMTVLCKEPPKLGIVFYRDKDQGDAFVTKKLPLTIKLADLEPGLMQMTADGGGDIPEAILDALQVTIDQMNWSPSKRKNGGKIVILVGDAPPKPGTEQACQDIAKKGFAKGIKLYACKITTVEGHNDLSMFDAIAAAGGGSAISADFGRISANRYIGPDGKEIDVKTIDRPETQLIVAPASADQPPGEKILTKVLADAINPQYKDRVEPLAQTLLAYAQLKSEPEKRMSFAANTPPLGKATFNSQKK